MKHQHNATIEHSKNGNLVAPAGTPQIMPVGNADTGDPALPPEHSGELNLDSN